MLNYESADQLLAEPPARRYLHTVVLTALRDQATALEVRYLEGEAVLYYRVEGRDWELGPVPDEVYPELKDAVRAAARLVRPERPDVQVMFGSEGARFEPMEAGWLTYRLAGYHLDMVVRIDPREPFGSIRFGIEDAGDFAEAAGEALAAFAAAAADVESPEA